MYQITCRIEGIAPLLQNRFPLATLATLMDGARRKTAAPDYSLTWLEGMYAHNGLLVQPASHLEAAMTRAATGFRIKGSKNKTYKDLFRAYILATPDEIVHHYRGEPVAAPGPELLSEPHPHLSINIQRVIVARAAVARARLQIAAGWELAFSIQVSDDQIRPDVVETILREAGHAVGIGDYRPRYGRFKVVAWSVQE